MTGLNPLIIYALFFVVVSWKYTLGLFVSALTILAFVTGCGNNKPPVAPMSAAQLAQKQQDEIVQIQNNPNIPADKKASLLAQIGHSSDNERPGPPRAQ